MTERVLSEVQAAEVGFIPRLHGVARPDKGCSCEIREALHACLATFPPNNPVFLIEPTELAFVGYFASS